SIMKVIYDLWDTANDGEDTGSLGFGPIYRVMTGEQAVTPAFTSIFSFAAALKAENAADEAFINGLLEAEGINAAAITAFGEGETNDGNPSDDQGGQDADVLPVYTPIVPDGSVVNVCSNSQYDSDGAALFATGNKLSQHRFLRMNIDTPGRYHFEIRMTNV